jgi:hypothetical protein
VALTDGVPAGPCLDLDGVVEDGAEQRERAVDGRRLPAGVEHLAGEALNVVARDVP